MFEVGYVIINTASFLRGIDLPIHEIPYSKEEAQETQSVSLLCFMSGGNSDNVKRPQQRILHLTKLHRLCQSIKNNVNKRN